MEQRPTNRAPHAPRGGGKAVKVAWFPGTLGTHYAGLMLEDDALGAHPEENMLTNLTTGQARSRARRADLDAHDLTIRRAQPRGFLASS